MDAGLGGGLLDWQTAQPKVAKFARVCSYDRSGYGWSESGPNPRTSPRIVKELHALLKNGGVDGPYVLVGHSFGGANAQLYAAEYPDEVAGMVLVDSALDVRVLDKDLRDDLAKTAPSPLTIKVAAPLGIASLSATGSESGEGGPPRGSRRRGARSTAAPATSTRSPTRPLPCRRASPRRPTPPRRWGTSR
jgi:pimeloyl-ACP methyl ester carboxylesterase